MNIVRTIVWVLLAIALVLFAINNWQPVEVRVWQTLILETKIAALAIGAFLLGLVPMWLVHRTTKWRLRRRISNLETTLSGRAVTPPDPAPALAAAEPAPAARQ